MRLVLPRFFTVALATLCAGLGMRAADVTKVDPSVRVEKLDPGPDTTKSVESITKKRADSLQNSRAALAGLIEEPKAPLAGRRAAVEVAETRAKTIVDHKDASLSTADTFARKDSALAGQSAQDKLQPKTNVFGGNGRIVDRYQQGIRAASGLRPQLQPDLGRQTTFDQLNRFVFKRNGPGTDGGNPLVRAAGGGTATILPTTASRPAPATGPDLIGGGDGGIDLINVFSAPGKPPPDNISRKMNPTMGPLPGPVQTGGK